MITDITTYYVEMTDPDDLRPKRIVHPDLEVKQVRLPSPEFSRFLYTAVGGGWYWTDRLPWTYQQWQAWLERPEVQMWVAYVSGTPAGYFELEAQADDNVEIVFFGLLPPFIGQGLGGHLLTIAVETAWQMGATKRVWLHTCTMDHPIALAHYRARTDRQNKRYFSPVPSGWHPRKTPPPTLPRTSLFASCWTQIPPFAAPRYGA